MQAIQHYLSPLGAMTMAGEGEALTGLWFDGQKYDGATLDETYEAGDMQVFAQTRRWLDLYFGGKVPDFTPPLSLAGSPFRREVGAVLLGIPYGQTTTYGQIAKLLGERHQRVVSAQAVGGAVGHNPISIIVPCHRVVGASGSLTGYAGGVERKLALLRLEGVDLSRLSLPAKGTAL